MVPPALRWPSGLIFWTVFLWALIPELRILRRARQSLKSADSRDSGSFRLMSAALTTALVVAFPLAFLDRWSFTPDQQLRPFIIGVLLIMLGSLIRRLCWRTLGELFTGDIQARAGQPVIHTGPYRLVRHPSYTGGILVHIGVGLALCNWLSLAVLTLTAIATYAYRVRIEERVLVETIGEPYRIYMRETRRFIPYVI